MEPATMAILFAVVLMLCLGLGVWIGPALLELLKGAAELRANKLTHGEYETEATWSTRKYMPFVMQRISVAVQLAAASEIRLAMGVGQATAVA